MATIESPCISVCEVDMHTGLCKGCMRTLDEVKVWPNASDAEKIEILQRLEERKQNLGTS